MRGADESPLKGDRPRAVELKGKQNPAPGHAGAQDPALGRKGTSPRRSSGVGGPAPFTWPRGGSLPRRGWKHLLLMQKRLDGTPQLSKGQVYFQEAEAPSSAKESAPPSLLRLECSPGSQRPLAALGVPLPFLTDAHAGLQESLQPTYPTHVSGPTRPPPC